MNKLSQLINELCPNGVEYINLGEFASINKGEQLNLTKMIDYAPYPVMNGGASPSGNYEEFNTEENTVTVSQGGASAGYVNFLLTKFWAGAHCYVVKPVNERLNNKYLYFFLKNSETKIQEAKYGAGIPGLNKSTLENLSVPLPPLPVQEEIVRILDTFSGVVAELEAEQAARVRQYEHYRNELLSFDSNSKIMEKLLADYAPNGVECVKLGEIAPPIRGVRVIRSQLAIEGGYPVYQNSLTPLGYHEESNCPKNTPFVISAGAAGEIGYSSVEFWAADDCFYFVCPENLQNRFLYHALMGQREFLFSRVRRASVPRLARSVIEGIKIPLPPLDVQEQIVSILDRFDTLVNDLKSGLPAEIALRRKQYEYYRDKLLTFTCRA